MSRGAVKPVHSSPPEHVRVIIRLKYLPSKPAYNTWTPAAVWSCYACIGAHICWCLIGFESPSWRVECIMHVHVLRSYLWAGFHGNPFNIAVPIKPIRNQLHPRLGSGTAVCLKNVCDVCSSWCSSKEYQTESITKACVKSASVCVCLDKLSGLPSFCL